MNQENQKEKDTHKVANGQYREVYETVQYCLSTKVEKERIDKCIYQLVDVFQNDPFNEFLLSFYTQGKENYIISHITNNLILAIAFGGYLGFSKEELYDLGCVAFGHDFGMADYTHLFQKNSQLEESENRMIQKHTSKSSELFKGIFSDKVLQGILDVHENVSGSGYPNGKTAVEISALAKITAVCDVFEALTHARNFRREFSPYEAIKMIIKKKDMIFDGRVVKRFVEFLSIYPIGSIVNLNTGETGLVVGSNRGFPTRSIVKVLLTPKKEVDESNKFVNLLEDNMLYISGTVSHKDESEIVHFINPRRSISI